MVQGLYASGPSARLGVFGRLSYELTDNVSARIEGLYLGAVPVNNFGGEHASAYAVFGVSAGYGFEAGDGDGRVFLLGHNLSDRTFSR